MWSPLTVFQPEVISPYSTHKAPTLDQGWTHFVCKSPGRKPFSVEGHKVSVATASLCSGKAGIDDK